LHAELGYVECHSGRVYLAEHPIRWILMAKRLERVWVVIDKRSREKKQRPYQFVDAVFGDGKAAHEHVDSIEATDYDRRMRDVVVVPFDVLYEPPRHRDLWRIALESGPLHAPVPEQVRVFEHDEPRWFRTDTRLPVVEPPTRDDQRLRVTDQSSEGCFAAFVQAAAEHEVEYYAPEAPLRMPGALPTGVRRHDDGTTESD
jgi:hypothetical protein